KNCLARQVASRVEIPLLVKCIIPDEVDISYQPLHLALVLDIFTKNDHILDVTKDLALKCGLQVSLIVLYPEVRAMGYPGTGLGSSLIWAVSSTNREIEDEATLIASTCERKFKQSGLKVGSSVVPYKSADQIADLLHGMATDLTVMSLPGLKQPTPVKIFDISRFSHLPSLFVPA
ncbi:MAG: hypothetical protein WBV22_09760, partial [Anaerolineaceae bacterium]